LILTDEDQTQASGDDPMVPLDFAAVTGDDGLERLRLGIAGDVELEMNLFALLQHEIGGHEGTRIVQIDEQALRQLAGGENADPDLSFRPDTRLSAAIHKISSLLSFPVQDPFRRADPVNH
jgi:hypothetical protein